MYLVRVDKWFVHIFVYAASLERFTILSYNTKTVGFRTDKLMGISPEIVTNQQKQQ
jgi:hypothetical protein